MKKKSVNRQEEAFFMMFDELFSLQPFVGLQIAAIKEV